MVQKSIKRIVLIGVAVVVLAIWALPAYAASPRDPGPVGWRWIPEVGQALYCDNFYDGPPIATNPDGSPVTEYHKQHVYWCYPEQQEGFWIPTSASYFL